MDADAVPADPFRALVHIMIDAETLVAVGVRGPSLRLARGIEAGEIGDQQRPLRREDPDHLGDRDADVRNVDQRQVADDEIERPVRTTEHLRATDAIVAVRV